MLLKTTEYIHGKKKSRTVYFITLHLFLGKLFLFVGFSVFFSFFFFPCECTAETVVVDVTVMHCSDPRWKNSVVTSEEGAGFLEGGVLFMQ